MVHLCPNSEQSRVDIENASNLVRALLRVCKPRIPPRQPNANQQIETWIFNFWQGSHQGVNLVVYLSTFWCSQFGQIMPRFLTNARKYLTNCALRRRRYFAFCDRRKVFAALTVNKMLSLICKRQERVSAPRVPHTRIRWIGTRRGESWTSYQPSWAQRCAQVWLICSLFLYS